MKRKSFAVLRMKEVWPDLKYVQDAKKNLEIEIKQCDVNKAVRNDPMRCAIKIGAKRFLHCEDIAVGRSTAYIKHGNKAIRYIVPMGAQKELIAFDRGGSFIPGVYKLMKPWAGNSMKHYKVQGPHPTKNTGTGGKRPTPHSMRPRISA